eukprot:9478014-Pyramimonas_sp.AAC.2
MRLDAAASDVAFVFSVPLAPLIRVPFLSSLECRSFFGGRTEGHLKGVRKRIMDTWMLLRPLPCPFTLCSGAG